MRPFIYLLIILFNGILIGSNSYALEIDEKLTLRILKVSETKKTILINRGIEDGLNVGDHAKFFLTTGVIARGVVVKVSPVRSVWSIYRLVSPENITQDRVLNLKISSAVKVTDDPTKALNTNPDDEEIDPATPETLSIPVDETYVAPAPSKVKTRKGDVDAEKDDMSALEDEESPAPSKIEAKTMKAKYTAYGQHQWELMGGLNLQSMGISNTGKSSSSGNMNHINLLMEMERYFLSRTSWYYDLSLVGLVNYQSFGITNVDGHKLTNTSLDVGLGMHWHVFEQQHVTNKPIWFALLYFGLSFTNDSSELNVAATKVPSTSLTGGGSFFSVGAGMKYNLTNYWGMRLLADVYRRQEVYAMSDGSESTKTMLGPRVYFGISYRF